VIRFLARQAIASNPGIALVPHISRFPFVARTRLHPQQRKRLVEQGIIHHCASGQGSYFTGKMHDPFMHLPHLFSHEFFLQLL
jgi:hypothetical protein